MSSRSAQLGLRENDTVSSAINHLKVFYDSNNDHIHESHGFTHAMAVFRHAQHAVGVHKIASISTSTTTRTSLTSEEKEEILLAALLHDVDDRKYFKNQQPGEYMNARIILQAVGILPESLERILAMIDLVSCSKHGNSCPEHIQRSGAYHLLIPRWSDRLEAVGRAGVVRCYQYNLEQGQPLSSDASPRPQTIEEVWKYATAERFEAYQARGGSSKDMISHYYDKLLHVACPPSHLVQNTYLETKARDSSKELLEVCLRYGRNGVVDEKYIQGLMSDLATNAFF